MGLIGNAEEFLEIFGGGFRPPTPPIVFRVASDDDQFGRTVRFMSPDGAVRASIDVQTTCVVLQVLGPCLEGGEAPVLFDASFRFAPLTILVDGVTLPSTEEQVRELVDQFSDLLAGTEVVDE